MKEDNSFAKGGVVSSQRTVKEYLELGEYVIPRHYQWPTYTDLESTFNFCDHE